MTEALNQSTQDLLKQFLWYEHAFNTSVQNASNDFLSPGLNFKLVSVSKNMNTMFQNDSYFVTKIKVNPQFEVYIRCSDKAVNTVLENALGKNKRPFKLSEITELEAKLITSFNDNLYNFLSDNLTIQSYDKKSFDLVHLTFVLSDSQTGLSGKIIISIPAPIVYAQPIQSSYDKFSNEYFRESLTDVDILIGSTVFTVQDLKSLEVEDIIVLDNSNLQELNLRYGAFEKPFRIAPNPALIISLDNNGGEEMASNTIPTNLWDSIQVEMGAEFDKVKISLGELKNIEEGLVVDISSVYNNNVTLKVEEKTIATGELVIVNDRYGVKVNKIFAEKIKEEPVEAPMEQPIGEAMPETYEQQYEAPVEEAMPTETDDSDLDYSDFEIEDEDL